MRSVGAIALAATMLALACTGGPANEPGPAGSAALAPVVIGHSAEDVGLDPNSTNATNWQSVLQNIYDTLVIRGRDGDQQPALAESWRAVTSTSWEFTLRRGVKFHNGTDFTPEDVRFTVERVAKDAKSPQYNYVALVKEVSVIDDRTVRFELKSPDPTLADQLMLVPIGSKRYFEEVGAQQFSAKPVGTGPYEFVEWKRGEQLVMSANGKYWRGVPPVARVIWRVIPEPAALVASLQTGEVDIAVNVPPDDVTRLSGKGGVKIQRVPSQRSIFLVLDNTAGPLKDVRVRQALNYGLDRQGIIDKVLLGYAKALPTLLGEMYLGSDAALKPYAYDPVKARQLLAEAGYPNGFEITFYAPTGRYVKDKEVAEAITGQYAQIGVRVKLQLQEFGTLLTNYRAHKLSPMYMIGYGTPVWDNIGAFRSYLRPSNPQTYYVDPEVERLVAGAEQLNDRTKRAEAFRQINDLLYQRAAFVFLYLQEDLYGVNDRIEWTARSDERIWLYEIRLKN